MIPQNKIDEILSRVSIADLIGSYIEIKRSGNRRYIALCPFHNEKTPSFSISDDKGLYYCFGCGASGNAITFLREYRKLSFYESLEELAKIAGVDISQYDDSNEKGTGSRRRYYEINKLSMLYFHKNLLNHPAAKPARDYLIQRGISNEMVKQFRIGYGGDQWQGLVEYLRKRGVNDDEMIEASLARKGEQGIHDIFKDRLIFPIFDHRNNEVAGFGGRVLPSNDHPAKYLNSSETSVFHKKQLLFGLNFAHPEITHTNQCWIVEGYFDVIACFQAGISNVVAPLGTALNESHLMIVKRYCENAVLIFDGDEAGLKAASRGLDIAVNSGVELNIEVAILPDQQDPYDFIMDKGGENFRDYVNTNKLQPIDFQLRYYARILDPQNQKLKFLREIFSFITRLRSAILRQKALKQTANFVKENLSVIQAEYQGFVRKHRVGSVIEDRSNQQLRINPLELDFIAVLLAAPEMAGQLSVVVNPDKIYNSEIRELFQLILSNPDRNTKLLLNYVKSPEIIQRATLYATYPDLNPGILSAYNLRRSIIRSDIEKLEKELSDLEKNKDYPQRAELLNQKRNLSKELLLELEELNVFIKDNE